MGVVQSHGTGPSVNSCLINALGGNHELIAFPSKPLYQFTDVQRWNLAIEVVPAAVTYPETTREVAEIIRCATEAELKVQPKSGGHSHANYGSLLLNF
jgi:FAD/FMN-containing dehydrogenase